MTFWPGQIGPIDLLAESANAPRFAPTLAELNATVAPWGVVFSHAWSFDEASGNAIDMATSGGINLVPTNSPTQGVSTGLVGDDKGVTFADNTTQHMLGTSALSWGTGDGVLYCCTKLTAPASSDRDIYRQAATSAIRGRIYSNGALEWLLYDGTTLVQPSIATSHSTADYHDILFALDRVAGTDRCAFGSELAVSAIATPPPNSLNTGAGAFAWGGPAGAAAAQTVTFVAWGTTVGSLISAGTTTNLSAAITALRRARGGL